MKTFNVLNFNITRNCMEEYDVLPFLRSAMEEKRFDFEKVKSKEDLKDWIKHASQYQFWGRCQYEFLIAPWPFGSKEINDKLKTLLTPDFDINDYRQSIDFYNIIMTNMYKIDIHEQIMMNIDIITNILYKEFYGN